MKRFFWCLLIILCCLVPTVSALRLDFQNYGDFAVQQETWVSDAWDYITYAQDMSAGNSYMYASSPDWCICMGDDGPAMVNSEPLYMQYFAYTRLGGEACKVNTYDAGKNLMDTLYSGTTNQRIEVLINGGNASIWVDGTLQHYSSHSPAFTINPSYIGVASYGSLWYGWHTNCLFDDVVWGSSDWANPNATDKYILSGPGDGSFLMKDIMNPAASGLYVSNQTDPNGTPTLISSSLMTTRYARATNKTEVVYLANYGKGNHQWQNISGYAGTLNWNLTDFFEDDPTSFHMSPVPYGIYVTQISGINQVSQIVPYIGSGATINFDKVTYGVGEEARVTVVLSEGYYDTDVYDYHVVIQDIFGTEVDDQPISFTSYEPYTGSVYYTWSEDQDEGIYYGLMYATRKSDDEEILMNYDTCELTMDLLISGYIKDAPTAAALPNATVNVTQGTPEIQVSGVNGNYTMLTSWNPTAPTTISCNITGYDNYTHSFVPMTGGAIQINISMMPINPPHDEIAVGGLVMKPPYNNTIDNARVDIYNATLGTTYSVYTNGAGYYIQDYMPNEFWWDIWGSKEHFANSSIYHKYVFGV